MARYSRSNQGTSSVPPEFRILGESFAAGIFAGAAIKIGIDADPFAILQNTTEITVEKIESTNPEKNFSGLFGLFGIACFIVSLLGIIEVVTNVNDWRVGVSIYILGFIFGFFLTILAL